MKAEAVVLTGDKVELVPMTFEHVEVLYEAAQHPDIWTYTREKIITFEDASTFVHRALSTEGTLPFVIVEQGTGRTLGSTRLYDISAKNRSLELGVTWLRPEVWQTGVNRECKYMLLKYSFETLGAVRVQIKADARNLRSQRAIEGLGAVREGILRNHMILPDGSIRDTVFYSITDREWLDVKRRLEDRLLHHRLQPISWSGAVLQEPLTINQLA